MMSHTKTLPPPKSKPVTERMYELVEEYQAVIVVANRIWNFRASPGYQWDGASIPRFAWTITGVYPMAAMIQAPSLIHDALYGCEYFTRLHTDICFRDDMKRNRYSRITRNIFYRSVRWGGGVVWRRHTPESIQEQRRWITVTPVVY